MGSFSAGAACTAAPAPEYLTYVPPAGCSCAETWSYNGKVYCERTCAAPDNDPNGPWCFTDGPCNGMSWAYCSPGPSAPPEPPAPDCAPADPTAQGMTAPAGCSCAETWSYNGNLQCGGRCANPDRDPNGPWCFTAAPCNGMNWAYCRL